MSCGLLNKEISWMRVGGGEGMLEIKYCKLEEEHWCP